jgi:2-deoxy-D-gluconate 3-dehydrogenase
MFSLEGKTAVVTGARRGLGFAMAKALAEAGANIVAVSANIESSGSEIQTVVESYGRKFEAYSCNFTDSKAVESLSERLAEKPIDILVNNAGTIERSPAVDHTFESWDRVIEVNLSSQFRFTQPIARQMLARGSGKIIFTASLLSFQGGINVAAYTSSKSAIAGLTRALSNEWAGSGVNVNAIVPGYFATDNTSALRADKNRSHSILERIPLGRWGEPQDISGATVFLSSAASDYISGITLPVDGGWLGR